MAVQRPLPRLEPLNRPFWTGGGEGELRIFHCQDCNGWIHPPTPVCRHCLSENVGPKAVAGTGEVYSLTVNHQAWAPGAETPYIIARIALDGAAGVLLTTNIVGCAPDAVDIGDKVKVTFEQHGEIFVPLFEKAV